MIDQTIGFIGAGQMATALAHGFVRSQLLQGDKIVAFDPSPVAAEKFAELIPGALVLAGNQAVVDQASVIFLAVKPQYVDAVLTDVLSRVTPAKLFVSVAAGVTLTRLCDDLETKRVIRVMPNTPCLVGVGASAFCLGHDATPEDAKLVEKLLSSVGIAYQLEEKLLDAVTGLSGSGPAFVYEMIEALSDGGVRVGLPRDVATALAAQTVRGAAEMVLTTREHPAVLKDRVASPGGTTIAGLHVMEERAVRGALMSAVQAATQRSRELGQK